MVKGYDKQTRCAAEILLWKQPVEVQVARRQICLGKVCTGWLCQDLPPMPRAVALLQCVHVSLQQQEEQQQRQERQRYQLNTRPLLGDTGTGSVGGLPHAAGHQLAVSQQAQPTIDHRPQCPVPQASTQIFPKPRYSERGSHASQFVMPYCCALPRHASPHPHDGGVRLLELGQIAAAHHSGQLAVAIGGPHQAVVLKPRVVLLALPRLQVGCMHEGEEERIRLGGSLEGGSWARRVAGRQ